MKSNVGPWADDAVCALCGQPAEGWAAVGDLRLCHGDERDCYHLHTVWPNVGHDQLVALIAASASGERSVVEWLVDAYESDRGMQA